MYAGAARVRVAYDLQAIRPTPMIADPLAFLPVLATWMTAGLITGWLVGVFRSTR